MAVSYEAAEQARSKAQDGIIVENMEKEIDAKLMDAKWFAEWRCGVERNPFWRFSFQGNVSDYVLEQIKLRYMAAGWTEVKADNVTFPNPSENSTSIELHMSLAQ